MKKTILIGLGILIVLLGIVFAVRFLFGGSEDAWICVNNQWVKHGKPSSPKPDRGCGEETEIANPASVYCGEQGGSLEIRKSPDGSESGWCTMPDGKVCEEWQFFRTKVCK